MRRRFFLENLTKMLVLSLLPIMLLTFVFILVLLPAEKKTLHEGTHNNLSLIQENMDMLLNDSNKVMNMLQVSTYANSIYQILEADGLNYIQFITLKQTAAQLNAIVNSRNYIDSIYVYLPNSKGGYLTNRAHIYNIEDSVDQNWLEICDGDKPYRLIRRQVNLYPNMDTTQDFLTVVQEDSKGNVVAVNIVVSYFKRLLNNLNLKDGEIIMFVDDGTLLLSTMPFPHTDEVLNHLSMLDESTGPIEIDDMIISKTSSGTTGLDLISMIPKSVLYSSIYRLMIIAFITILICLFISVLFSIRYTINVSKQLYSILDLMEAAIANKELPKILNSDNSLYSTIITNMIQTFTQNDFLKVSLNEQKFQALTLELSALQYQINPHFLSNTLQMIDFEILRMEKRPTSANKMIQELSHFLQYSLCAPNSDITLEEEISATKYYTNLMSSRYGNQVTFDWDIAPDAMCCHVPKLILQPMIENCIKHGIQDSDSILHVSICIAYLEDRLLSILVRDDGAGISKEKLCELRASLSNFKGFQEKHIGLQNLFRRLRLRFPQEQCSIFLDSRPGEGFSIKISIEDAHS